MSELFSFIQQNTGFTNSLVAILALLVSCFSICLAAYTASLLRSHNYKSMTPIGSFPISDYENNIKVVLKNTGVGPLIVKKFSAIARKMDKDSLISFMPQPPDEIDWDTFHDNLNGSCIPPNEELVLVCLSGDPNNEEFSTFRDQVRRTLSEIKIQIEYMDIYERTMPKTERDLSWFGRHFD